MEEKNIDKLLVKYFSNEASANELQALENWASNNKASFKQAVKLNLEVQRRSLSVVEVEAAFKNIKNQVGNKKVIALKKANNWRSLLKYAALLIVFCSVGAIYFVQDTSKTASVDVSKEIKLELADGSVKIIKEGVEQEIKNNQGEVISTQEESALKYNAIATAKAQEKVTFNTLSIPFGKMFKLVLSDGTRVTLNAGSSLRYPIHFGKEGMRQVYLDGEGYFEVAKNTAQPFIVSTNRHDIKVLGTRFNVNSYNEDNCMQTCLVEGAVGIYSNKKTFEEKNMLLLKPQQKATWHPEEDTISIEEIDTSQYTAWVDGTLLFFNTPFSEMIRRIERHYNVSIQNNVSALDSHVFTAKFEKETIDQVMRAIQLYSHFEYTINNNQIIINQTLKQTVPMKK